MKTTNPDAILEILSRAADDAVCMLTKLDERLSADGISGVVALLQAAGLRLIELGHDTADVLALVAQVLPDPNLGNVEAA